MSKDVDMQTILQNMDMHVINLTQKEFEAAIQTGDFELMNYAHAERDKWIQNFASEYGRLPEQDRSSRKWR